MVKTWTLLSKNQSWIWFLNPKKGKNRTSQYQDKDYRLTDEENQQLFKQGYTARINGLHQPDKQSWFEKCDNECHAIVAGPEALHNEAKVALKVILEQQKSETYGALYNEYKEDSSDSSKQRKEGLNAKIEILQDNIDREQAKRNGLIGDKIAHEAQYQTPKVKGFLDTPIGILIIAGVIGAVEGIFTEPALEDLGVSDFLTMPIALTVGLIIGYLAHDTAEKYSKTQKSLNHD